MTDKKTYWLTDDRGYYALVTGTEERERLQALGWMDTDEPTGDVGFIWAWREGIAAPGSPSLPYFRESLSHAGWVPGPPPGGVHPATVVEEPEEPSKPKTGKAAVSGSEKG